MGDKSVSFKVCLNDATSEPEVRRFVIDRDVSSSLNYLQEKLITIFPALLRKDFKLTWTDDEGDRVTIRSDDELIIALTEMKGPIYKLAINILSDKDNSKDEEGGNSEGEEHPGVTCDGCEKPVIGFRYKCVICPDYDLCGHCETKGLHPGHNMIRIASPQGAWPHHFYRRLNRMHDKMQKRSSSFGAYPGRAEQEKHSWESTPTMFGAPCRGPEPSSGGAAASRSGCSRPGNFGPQRQKWLDAMIKGWSGSAAGETTAHQAAHQAARERAYSHHQEIHQAAAAAAADTFKQASAAAHVATEGDGKGKPQPQQTSFNDEFTRSAFGMTSPTDYLKNLGQMVASALDPLGVDVKIDVETPTGNLHKIASDPY
jgi:sequestosome 1